MADNIYMNLSGFGIQTEVLERNYREFSMPQADGTAFMKAYVLMPGVEVYYNDFNTKSHFHGEGIFYRYYQISYCHSGMYVSRITAQRLLKVQAKGLLMFRDIANCVDAYMPLGYYKGINIIFYPDFMPEEARKFFECFHIDIRQMFRRLLGDKVFSRFSTSPHVAEILEKLFEMTKKGDRLHMKLYLMHLLVELGHYEGAVREDYHFFSRKTEDTMAGIKDYIEENMERHFTLKELADRYQISVTSLKDNFKILYGYGPYEFLKRYRMSKAEELLKETELPIGEIAGRIGYENPSKFSSAFSKMYGMTPKNYRKNGGMEHFG